MKIAVLFCTPTWVMLNRCSWVFAADGSLSADVFPPGFTQFSSANPSLRLNSPAFCKALFEIYLAPNSVVQDGRKKWTAEAIELVN